jgi:sterol desaturase/sphingolipid hydroxylase (fatty acid hydroxylase superfamily)
MEAIFTAGIPATFIALMLLERVFPARRLPAVRFWMVKGVVFFAITAVITSIPAVILEGHSLLHLHGPIAAFAGFLLGDLVFYGVHRLEHNWHGLWRWTHQMHHSAERLDIAGSSYFHPFELLVLGAISAVVTFTLGLTPVDAALAGLLGAFAGMFPHLNVRTPTWLGYLIQRPEAHSVHHARGVHAYNYGNVPWWDLALGTFRNPDTFTGPQGFWDGASSKLVPMLAGRDVAEPTA